MQKVTTPVFDPKVPPDLEHAALIREEAFDWLDSSFPGKQAFTTTDILAMAGERGRRWLITRLRARGIGVEELFGVPAAADALTVLFLRARDVKFGKAIDAVVGDVEVSGTREPRYGGIWNRLLITALDRLRRRVPPRLLGSAVFALLGDPKDQLNCLVIVRQLGATPGSTTTAPTRVDHDYVYDTILERPAPSCSVIAPSLEVLFLGSDQLPVRAEVRSRHFVGLKVATEREVYEVLLGTIRPASVSADEESMEFVGRILDIVFVYFEEFYREQSSQRFEADNEPEPGSADDLQLWLITQFLTKVYPGSLSEVIEASEVPEGGRALATSTAKPWEPSLWDPPKSLEMLSGYASRVGVPLVVESVEHPWTTVIKSIGPEMRFLRSDASAGGTAEGFSAAAMPFSNPGSSNGSLYILMPRLKKDRLDNEVRILAVFSLVTGEIIERQRAAKYSAEVYADIVNSRILDQEQFKRALLGLFKRKAGEVSENEPLRRDMRLPLLVLSAHRPEPEDFDPAVSEKLASWLVGTLRHLEWRPFLRSHLSDATGDYGADGFAGELPGAGMVIALDRLVSKDELDRIRNAFPTTINRTSPTNAPVKLLAYVLDLPAHRLLEASSETGLDRLADEVEQWAYDVTSVLDDVNESYVLARKKGDWDAALRRIRRALQKEGGRSNSYLYRVAADCSFSLGNWPDALKYAREAATIGQRELGSGLVRSLCQEADAHLCLGDPLRAWDLYSEAALEEPAHPLPAYYRGQALLLMARLLDVYEDERRRAVQLGPGEEEQAGGVLNTLAVGAMDDLTTAADLLDRWGLIPETHHYRNFHLIPTLLGQGLGYLLNRSPGPAASKLQSARRSFPQDDLFYREFIFAKCWEQGLHRLYGGMLLGDTWNSLGERLRDAFGPPTQRHVTAYDLATRA